MTTKFRVAVVVFTEVEAVDFTDASYVAERAIRQAAIKATVNDDRVNPVIPFTQRGEAVTTVNVFEVREVGCAARNGYLAVTAGKDQRPGVVGGSTT